MTKTKIVFTSCVRYKEKTRQPEWDEIAKSDPDYLLLLGDNIYMDYGLVPTLDPFKWEPGYKPCFYSVDVFEKKLRQKYTEQWKVPEFANLVTKMRAKNGFFGTWDDHDFLWNNAYGADTHTLCGKFGKVAEKKAISRALFHEFINCSTLPSEVYCHVDTPFARVIILDNRYHATSPKAKNAVLLGSDQMKFLKDKLEHDLPYTIICGGLTLTEGGENWSNYDNEFGEFSKFVSQKKVIYLGGDIHQNLFKAPTPNNKSPCFEIISSGLSINKLALPFKFDDVRNWGTLDIDENEITVSLRDIEGTSRYRIDGNTWESQYLDRVPHP
ncbi:MAG: hypothetical protein C0406_05295 [Sideroxydans sp.]|nr:hypothetical protein [Sideroxydans sp.]